MRITGKEHLIQLEFVAGIDTDEDRLVIYDANMEDMKLNELIDLECPKQIRKNRVLQDMVCDRKFTNDVSCVVMEFRRIIVWPDPRRTSGSSFHERSLKWLGR